MANGQESKGSTEDRFHYPPLTVEQLYEIYGAILNFTQKNKETHPAVQTLLKPLKNLAAFSSDLQRTHEAMALLASAYANIYMDERKKTGFSTSKGKNLEFIESLIVGIKSLAPILNKQTAGKLDAKIFGMIALSPDITTTVVAHLLKRALVEGIGLGDELIFKNACKVIVRMGDKAVRAWNAQVEQEIPRMFEEVRNHLKIALNIDEQNEKDFARAYKILSEDKHKAILGNLYSAEILVQLLKNNLEKTKALLADVKDVAKREYMLWGNREFESLIEKLDVVISNKAGRYIEPEVYQAVMEAYSNIYIHDKNQAGFKRDMEEVLSQYHKKTDKKTFIGEKNSDVGIEIFSSTSFNKVGRSEGRVKIIENIFKQALAKAQVQDARLKEQNKAAYINAVKAVVGMGDLAIEAWNHMAARLGNTAPNQSRLNFPDLIINQANNDDKVIGNLYGQLVANSSLHNFLTSGVLDQEPKINPDSHIRDRIHSATTQGSASSASSSLNSLSSSEEELDEKKEEPAPLVPFPAASKVPLSEKEEKEERLLVKAATEFNEKINAFHQQMHDLVQNTAAVESQLREFSPDDADWFAYYMEVYKNLTESPFVRWDEINASNSLSYIQHIRAAVLKDSSDPQSKFTSSMKKTMEAFKGAVYNHNYFLSFIDRLLSKKKVQTDPELTQMLTHLKGQNGIIAAFQYSIRYKMILEEMQRHMSPQDGNQFGELVIGKINQEIVSVNEQLKKTGGKGEGTKDSETTRKFLEFLPSRMTREQLADFIHTLESYIQDSDRNPSVLILEELNEQLKDIDSALSDYQRMQAVRDAVMQPYLSLYLAERSKELRSTQKGPHLVFLEDLMWRFNAMNLSEADEDKGLKKDTLDARILSSFKDSEEKCLKVVEQVFNRAMMEGFGGWHNKSIYVNARKAVTRMGEAAINKWNLMALNIFGNNVAPFWINQAVAESESDISASYDKLYKRADIREAVNKAYLIETLLKLFKEEIGNNALVKSLEAISRSGKSEADKLQLIQFLVLDYYIKAHCPESNVRLFNRSAGVIDLSAMTSVLSKFYQYTEDPLLGRHEPLAMAKNFPQQSHEWAKLIFNHAMKFVLNSPFSDAARSKKVYIDDLKTIINMGPVAIAAWNEQVTKSSHSKLWPQMVIQSISLSDKEMGSLYDSLAKIVKGLEQEEKSSLKNYRPQ